jgi:hypothetical protein
MPAAELQPLSRRLVSDRFRGTPVLQTLPVVHKRQTLRPRQFIVANSISYLFWGDIMPVKSQVLSFPERNLCGRMSVPKSFACCSLASWKSKQRASGARTHLFLALYGTTRRILKAVEPYVSLFCI